MKYFILLIISSVSFFANAQIKRYASLTDSTYFVNTQFRLIGPFRGGRATAVCGSLKNKNLFYMGSTGGGVWRTKDGGSNWQNISDEYFGGSIGSIALAPSNENIIYVGEGENTMRGNVSEGINGIWRSDNAGITWKKLGLNFARHITRIVVHPHNPDIVWVAVTGSVFGSNENRGVYKTIDGGKNWKKVLYSGNAQAGAIEITLHPTDENILYASTWRVLRTPYSMESGGAGSAIWKSTDGGETWQNISKLNGLPTDSLQGISQLIIAPSDPNIMYCIVEAKDKGGLYRTMDAGLHWTLQSQDANIRQRAWYFSKINVDPQSPNTVYACNVEFWKSTDAGKSWKSVGTPHGDHHNLWIDPNDGNRMIIADDGGAQISFDGAEKWSTYFNQPTSQIYRLSADNHFPYHLLGGQQDNSSVRILSRTKSGAIHNSDFKATAGGEAGYDVADPLNPDIVYGGEYMGILRRYNHHTGEVRNINVWPESNIGSGAENLKYRFQWNYPLFFSPHNPKKLYAAGNHLFSSEDEGLTWKVLSPDLTTNDKTKQQTSGGPITKDNTTAEYYCTIFTATESALQKDLIYTGSDDGLVYVSKNGGANWQNITPLNAPKNIMWNCVETDLHNAANVYIVGTSYKNNNFTPYIYFSDNYGASWQTIVNGIEPMHFARCVRADKKVAGLLYCGTEYGMYISYDYGKNWKKFQLNLPIVPITDMVIKNNDLCIATQGRAIWILDNLTKVQQYSSAVLEKKLHVFDIEKSYRTNGYKNTDAKNAGQNPDNGVVIEYWLKEKPDSLKPKIRLLDKNDMVIKTFTFNDAKEKNKLEAVQGMNKFVWNMYYDAEEEMKDMVLWNGQITQGPKAIPAKYTARIIAGDDSITKTFEILPDPNFVCDANCYESQFNFLMKVKAKYDEVQKTTKKIRQLRSQLNQYTTRYKDSINKSLKAEIDSVQKSITLIEESLHQTKAKSGQDVLNYPIKLNDKIAAIYGMAEDGYTVPTQASKEVFKELSAQADIQIQKFNSIYNKEVKHIETEMKKISIPYFYLED